MEDKKDKEYFKDPEQTTMSGQPVSRRQQDLGEQGELVAGEGVFLADTEPEHIPVDEQHIQKPGVMRLSELIGESVINTQGESLGSLEDLVVDFHSGKVLYVVLSFGGFLDIGDKLFAVPASAFEFVPEEKLFVLNMNREQLENAPGFDKAAWPNMSDPRWNQQVQDFYLNASAPSNPPVGSPDAGSAPSGSASAGNSPEGSPPMRPL